MTTANKCLAHYHLPGLFEFYEFYKIFIPMFFEHREYFYDWCDIGSIYGAPASCLWGGGRVGFGEADARNVLALMNEYGISSRLTFSNSLLRDEHLSDYNCNKLCEMFAKAKAGSGAIIHSDLLLNYIKKNYPEFYFVSSTTKVLTKIDDLKLELNRNDFRYVVPDFRLNKKFKDLNNLPQIQKDKVEFLCNECCPIDCSERKICYENVSRKSLGEECEDHICISKDAGEGYRFSKAIENPSFIGINDICDTYSVMGFSEYKIEGRSLGSAVVLEMLIYYMAKPEYRLKIREAIYLDSMLDLF